MFAISKHYSQSAGVVVATFYAVFVAAPALPKPSLPSQKPQSAATQERIKFRELLQPLVWLPKPNQLIAAQDRVLASLQSQVENKVVVPKPPSSALLGWQNWRYYPQGDNTDIFAPVDPKAFRVLILEDLLWVTNTLKNDSTQQRRALRFLSTTTSNASVRLKDFELTMQIYDAFVLPYLDAAVADPTIDISRTRLLQDACGVHKNAGDKVKYKAALSSLIWVAKQGGSEQTSDWARYRWAIELAEEGQLSKAIYRMEPVKTEGLVAGRDRLLEKWRGQLQTQTQEALEDKTARPAVTN